MYYNGIFLFFLTMSKFSHISLQIKPPRIIGKSQNFIELFDQQSHYFKCFLKLKTPKHVETRKPIPLTYEKL